MSLDDIRARHVPYEDLFCAVDDQPWPCDTAVVLAALDAETANRKEQVRRKRVGKSVTTERLQGAEAREARLREALEITADALDQASEDSHAGWAYYGDAPGPGSPHSGPDDYNACKDSICRRRQRYVVDARAALSPDAET